ncbi:hypothetical protein [Streptomyces sp. NPDC058657]|uniref:hypothetical protein n=1 Tax=unclassified Streptomyces TaxID=2593676 RepID=UPI00364F0DA3
MKKRYKPRTALVAVAAVLASLCATAPAQAAADPGLDLSNFVQRPIGNKAALQARVASLNADLPNVGLNSILKEANSGNANVGQWNNTVCNDGATAGTSTPKNFGRSFCFDPDDNGQPNSEWWPQGLTSVADADQDQTWGDAEPGWNPAEHRPFIATWYNRDDWTDDNSTTPTDTDEGGTNTERKGVRISVIDSSTGKYAHILLVYPFTNASGNTTYMSVRNSQHYDNGGRKYSSLHAGGIVWYGNYLYVADTSRGFRVFDLRNIVDLGALPEDERGLTKTAIGRQDGKYYSHGYRYILPQSDGWTNTACDTNEPPPGTPCDIYDPKKNCTATDTAPTTSWASLDRSAARRHIVTGEYCNRNDVTSALTTGRVIRWPMNTDGGTPATDSNGNWAATAAHRVPYDTAYDDNGSIQGGAVIDGTYYLSQSRGSTNNGHLIIARPGSDGRLVETTARREMAIGIEDLTVWPGSPNRLWTLTEYPGKRMMFSVTP